MHYTIQKKILRMAVITEELNDIIYGSSHQRRHMSNSSSELIHTFNPFNKFKKLFCWEVALTYLATKIHQTQAIPKKGSAKECSNYCTIALISHASKVILKILQARLQQYEQWTPRCSSWFSKRQRNQISNCQHPLGHQKSKKVPEKHVLLLYWLCQSLWLCGSQYRNVTSFYKLVLQPAILLNCVPNFSRQFYIILVLFHFSSVQSFSHV